MCTGFRAAWPSLPPMCRHLSYRPLPIVQRAFWAELCYTVRMQEIYIYVYIFISPFSRSIPLTTFSFPIFFLFTFIFYFFFQSLFRPFFYLYTIFWLYFCNLSFIYDFFLSFSSLPLLLYPPFLYNSHLPFFTQYTIEISPLLSLYSPGLCKYVPHLLYSSCYAYIMHQII